MIGWIVGGAAALLIVAVAVLKRRPGAGRHEDPPEPVDPAELAERAERQRLAELLNAVQFCPPFRDDDQPYTIDLASTLASEPTADVERPTRVALADLCATCTYRPLASGQPYRDAAGPTVIDGVVHVAAPDGAKAFADLVAEAPLSIEDATDVAIQIAGWVERGASFEPRARSVVLWRDAAGRLVAETPIRADECPSCRMRRLVAAELAQNRDERSHDPSGVIAIAGLWFHAAFGASWSSWRTSADSANFEAPSIERVVYGVLAGERRHRPASAADLAAALVLAARDHGLDVGGGVFGEPAAPMTEPPPQRLGLILEPFIVQSFGPGTSPARPWPGDRTGSVSSGYVPPPGIQAGIASFRLTVRYGVVVGHEPGAIY